MNNENPSSQQVNTSNELDKTPKKIKLEEKPFKDFIEEDLIPSLKSSLKSYGIVPTTILLKRDKMPIVGSECSMVYSEISKTRKFWLCFTDDKLNSAKTIAIAENGDDPGLLESFLIDERKITLALLVSRILQRLNGQKWLGEN